MGMGLQFTCVDPRQMGVLEKWIGELNGTTPVEPAAAGATLLDTHHNGAGNNGKAPKEAGYVLNELILALMRKGALTEEEGKNLLMRLLHRDFLP